MLTANQFVPTAAAATRAMDKPVTERTIEQLIDLLLERADLPFTCHNAHSYVFLCIFNNWETQIHK